MKFISCIIVKGNPQIPKDIVHFYAKAYDGSDYTDIPFPFLTMDRVCEDLHHYDCISEIDIEKAPISEDTRKLIETIRKLGLKSFLIVSFMDVSSSYPIIDLIQIVIDNGRIVKGSLESPLDPENGYHFSTHYGYDDYKILYSGYGNAEDKYLRGLEGQP